MVLLFVWPDLSFVLYCLLFWYVCCCCCFAIFLPPVHVRSHMGRKTTWKYSVCTPLFYYFFFITNGFFLSRFFPLVFAIIRMTRMKREAAGINFPEYELLTVLYFLFYLFYMSEHFFFIMQVTFFHLISAQDRKTNNKLTLISCLEYEFLYKYSYYFFLFLCIRTILCQTSLFFHLISALTRVTRIKLTVIYCLAYE